MENLELVQIDVFCQKYGIEDSLVYTFEEFGCIQFEIKNDEKWINSQQLLILEKALRLHHDLEINKEGIVAILHLQEKIESLQSEILSLKNKLLVFEE